MNSVSCVLQDLPLLKPCCSVILSVVHDLAGNHMLHDFAANTGERDGLVVLSLILLSFHEDRDDVSGAPTIRPVTCRLSLEGKELCLLPAPSAVVVQGCHVLGICLA